ncbi:MAG TPA: (d)CMP kinase [Deltaproteobacteria bacterium]|nr:(d)CMP kinase [Deltaproteobacteria bacterium]HQB39468.1 (d)CMP kinase [Deltaproteobacteria bacterium]
MNPKGFVIAIDGPSGAGKSTIARLLAERLGCVQIDTGAMYRSVALLMRRAGLDIANSEAVASFCKQIDVRFDMVAGSRRVIANGEDVTDLIRTPEISLLTSTVSALKPVRQAMVAAQREMGRVGRVVLEGRDIGTVVFPDADLKVFLSASAEERGRRRFEELVARGEHVTLEETVQDVIRRDRQDSMRDLSPLRQADDAVAIDCTSMPIDDVLNLIEALAREKLAQAGGY